MRRIGLPHIAIVSLGVFAACALYSAAPTTTSKPASQPTTEPTSLAEINAMIARLQPAFAKMPATPQVGDWLDRHKEPGQTFEQWRRSRPPVAAGKRKILYFQELGPFNDSQRKILNLTIEGMGIYFGLETKTLPPIALDKIPEDAQRQHPATGKQLLTTYILDSLLKPTLPDDAAALIALTTSDLWPGENWNYVFGQASLTDRVGVWSIYRNGNPAKSGEEFTRVLRRTLKVATHETGHMFGMMHCTAYQCGMSGANNMPESDRYPLECCPDCMFKICVATGVRPIYRLQKMLAFCKANNLNADAEIYAKELATLGAATSAPTTLPQVVLQHCGQIHDKTR